MWSSAASEVGATPNSISGLLKATQTCPGWPSPAGPSTRPRSGWRRQFRKALGRVMMDRKAARAACRRRSGYELWFMDEHQIGRETRYVAASGTRKVCRRAGLQRAFASAAPVGGGRAARRAIAGVGAELLQKVWDRTRWNLSSSPTRPPPCRPEPTPCSVLDGAAGTSARTSACRRTWTLVHLPPSVNRLVRSSRCSGLPPETLARHGVLTSTTKHPLTCPATSLERPPGRARKAPGSADQCCPR